MTTKDYAIQTLAWLIIVFLSVFIHEYIHVAQCNELHGNPVMGMSYYQKEDWLPSPYVTCLGLEGDMVAMWNSTSEFPSYFIQFIFIIAMVLAVCLTWYLSKRRYNTVIGHTQAY